MARRRRGLPALNRVATVISQTLDIDDMLNGTLDTVLELAGTEHGWIYVANDGESSPFRFIHRGAYPREEDDWPLEGEQITDGILLDEDSVLNQATWARRAGVRSCAVVPLKAKGRSLGTLGIATDGGWLTQYDLSLFTVVGFQLGLAIESARLHEEARGLYADLEKSERRHRELVESAQHIIFTLDLKGRFTFVSRRIEELSGYSPTDLVGKPLDLVVAPTSRTVACEHFHRGLEDPEYRVSYRLETRSKDGEPVFLEVSVSTMVAAGRIVGQQGVARDVTDRVRLETEIALRQQEVLLSQRRQSELQDYSAVATRILEDERKRIARELHDDTAQRLVALSRRLDVCRQGLRESDEMASGKLDEAQDLIDEILTDVRRFSRDLRPSMLDDLGLLPALEWLTQDLSQRRGTPARLEILGAPRRLPADTALALFRIAQEALRNVEKHARATAVTVTVDFGAKGTVLEVVDNGVGFVPGEQGPDLPAASRLGLLGMRERAQLIGGELSVQSQPQGHTTVTVSVPT